MKKIILGLFLVLSMQVQAAGVSFFYGGNINPECGDETADLLCFGATVTTIPILLIMDEETVATDDAMIQLSDEISGLSDSTDMTEKMAKHFEVSTDVITETSRALQDSETGLSFETLTDALK